MGMGSTFLETGRTFAQIYLINAHCPRALPAGIARGHCPGISGFFGHGLPVPITSWRTLGLHYKRYRKIALEQGIALITV